MEYKQSSLVEFECFVRIKNETKEIENKPQAIEVTKNLFWSFLQIGYGLIRSLFSDS